MTARRSILKYAITIFVFMMFTSCSCEIHSRPVSKNENCNGQEEKIAGFVLKCLEAGRGDSHTPSTSINQCNETARETFCTYPSPDSE